MQTSWRTELFGEMRSLKIKDKELAAEAGVHPKYLSRVLNGHVDPKGAEQKLRSALDRIKDRTRDGIA